MNVLGFNLADFGSIQKDLIENFDFQKTSPDFLESQNNIEASFFRRIVIEQGFEVWVLSLKYNEDILLKQRKSSDLIYATHFYDFDGFFFVSEILNERLLPSQGIYIADGGESLNFKINANVRINFVSFIYSDKWLNTNLSNEPSFRILLDSEHSLKKYVLNEVFQNHVFKLINNAQNNINVRFLLKTSAFAILFNFLELIEKEVPIYQIKKLSIDDWVKQAQEILSHDFDTPLNIILFGIIRNGISQDEFIQLFKEKTKYNLVDFRDLKKKEFLLGLLKKGSPKKK